MSFLKLEIKSPMQILFSLCPDPSPPQEILVPCVRRRLECHPNLGGREGMGANQLCRIVFGISSQIGRDGHRDMGGVWNYYLKPPWFDETSRFESLCRYSEIQVSQRSQRVKTERDLLWVERGLTFWIFVLNDKEWLIGSGGKQSKTQRGYWDSLSETAQEAVTVAATRGYSWAQ